MCDEHARCAFAALYCFKTILSIMQWPHGGGVHRRARRAFAVLLAVACVVLRCVGFSFICYCVKRSPRAHAVFRDARDGRDVIHLSVRDLYMCLCRKAFAHFVSQSRLRRLLSTFSACSGTPLVHCKSQASLVLFCVIGSARRLTRSHTYA